MGRTATMQGNGKAGKQELGPGVSAECSLSGQGLRLLQLSLKKQWKRYCKELKRCQKKFSENAIHDSRVTTRRLASIAELLGCFLSGQRSRKVQRALKRHLDIFDELRDAQVQLPEVRKLRRRFPAAGPFFSYLLKRHKRLCRRTRRDIRHIKIRRLARLIASGRKQLKRWRKKCPTAEANVRLLSLVNAAFVRTAQLKTQIDPQNTRTIHCTRVAFKKFRYMVETLSRQLPLATEKLLTAMHHYQTLMGEVQDSEMLLQAFDKYLAKEPFEPQSTRRLRAQLESRRQRRVRKYLAAASQLYDFWPEPGTSALRQLKPPGKTRSLHSRRSVP